MWKQFGPVPRMKYGGRRFISYLEAGAKLDARVAPYAKKMRALYEKPFHSNASPGQLVKYCLGRVDRPDGWKNWQTIFEIYRSEIPASVRDLILTEATVREFSRHNFFYDPKVGGLRSNDQIWELLDQAKSMEFRAQLWGLLIQRGLKKEVLNRVETMSGDEIVTVLEKSYYSTHAKPYAPDSEEEIELWKRGFAHDPLAIAREIGNDLDQPGHRQPFLFLRPQIEDFWKQQLARSLVLEKDFPIKGDGSNWTAALSLLWNLEAEFDPEKWKKLANFRGHTVEKVLKDEDGRIFEMVVHGYPVCNRAADFLKKQGYEVERIRELQVLASKVPWKRE